MPPGRGHNGRDDTEGAIRDTVTGTYLHGPVLANSAHFADELIRRTLIRCQLGTDLDPLDDNLEHAAEPAIGRPR